MVKDCKNELQKFVIKKKKIIKTEVNEDQIKKEIYDEKI